MAKEEKEVIVDDGVEHAARGDKIKWKNKIDVKITVDFPSNLPFGAPWKAEIEPHKSATSPEVLPDCPYGEYPYDITVAGSKTTLGPKGPHIIVP